MKKETYAAKLNALLGIAPEVAEKAAPKSNVNNHRGVTEDEIQSFREAQGVIYFLQAPALFQNKVCKHCGAQYLVSRLYVAYCSYTCIKASLEELGVQWSRSGDIESLVNKVYEGNEPIWITKIPQLRKALEALTEPRSLPSNPSSQDTPSSESTQSKTSSSAGLITI